jgi:hypothetical protein
VAIDCLALESSGSGQLDAKADAVWNLGGSAYMLTPILTLILFCSPATTPTTQADELSRLRWIIADLTRQIEVLKLENEQLRAAKSERPRAMGNGAEIQIGQGIDEVAGFLGQPAQLREDNGTVKIYDFVVVSQVAHRALENGPPDDGGHTSYRIRCEVKDGKLAHYSVSRVYSGRAEGR